MPEPAISIIDPKPDLPDRPRDQMVTIEPEPISQANPSEIAPYGYTKAGAPRKRPARPAEGRPSTYKPEYADMIVETMAQGKSIAQFAASIGEAKQRIWQWAEQNDEFAVALSRAKTAEQAWWEKLAADNAGNKAFNALVWKVSCQARFREDYTERREIGGAVNVTISREDAALC